MSAVETAVFSENVIPAWGAGFCPHAEVTRD